MNALLEYKDFYGSSTKDLNLTAIYVKKLWCHKMLDWFLLTFTKFTLNTSFPFIALMLT